MRLPSPTSTLAALITVAVLGLSAPAAAPAAQYRLSLPLSDGTAFAVSQLRFKGAAPRTARPALPRPTALDPSYRGLYAIYRKRRGSTTYLTFVTLLLHKQEASASASEEEKGGELQLALFFASVGLGPSVLTISTVERPGSPTEPSPRIEAMLERGGVDTSAAVQSGDLGHSAVDTGHYDDGHAFGWRSAGTNKAIGNWLHLTADNAPYEEVIAKIERNLSADLDGDGDKGGRGGVDTVVEPPVITQP